MAHPSGQPEPPGARPRSSATRQRLLDAAAQLIAEVGWGRVTTRAVAERAGLPHGAVSYHFRGKQELLTEAAVATVEAMFPLTELNAVTDLAELIPMLETSSAPEAVDPVRFGVMVEAMRECGRDPELCGRLTSLLTAYREMVAGLVRAGQERGSVNRALDPRDVATLLIATGDGLLLHTLINPRLPVTGAARTLLTLIQT